MGFGSILIAVGFYMVKEFQSGFGWFGQFLHVPSAHDTVPRLVLVFQLCCTSSKHYYSYFYLRLHRTELIVTHHLQAFSLCLRAIAMAFLKLLVVHSVALLYRVI